MPKNVVYMKVKDDAFYVDLAIRSAIDHADMFILDTGSTDGTLDIIRWFCDRYPGRISLHQQEFGSNDFQDGEFRFAKGFREMDAANFALNGAREMCDPGGFVICLDADEVFNERFWELLDSCNTESLGHSTSLPITPFKVSSHPLDMQQWHGISLFDPHVRAWRKEIPAVWKPRNLDSNIHGYVDFGKELSIQVTIDTVHFHLHYSMGPKSIYSYMVKEEQVTQEAAKLLDMPVAEMHNQQYFMNRWPDWFVRGRFVPKNIGENLAWSKHARFCTPMSHPLPDYVVERWLAWGEPIHA